MESDRRTRLQSLAEAPAWDADKSAEDALMADIDAAIKGLKAMTQKHANAKSARAVKLKHAADEAAKKLADAAFKAGF